MSRHAKASISAGIFSFSMRDPGDYIGRHRMTKNLGFRRVGEHTFFINLQGGAFR